MDAFETRNEHEFRHIFFDLKQNPNQPLASFGGLSTFEMLLKTPNTGGFIEICLDNGSDFHKVSFKSINNFGIIYRNLKISTEKLEWNLPDPFRG